MQAHLLYFFFWPESQSAQCLFVWSKDVVITWAKAWWIWWMWKTLKVQVGNCVNFCMGRMGSSTVMLQQDICTHKSMSSGFYCRLTMLFCFLRRSEYVILVMVNSDSSHTFTAQKNEWQIAIPILHVSLVGQPSLHCYYGTMWPIITVLPPAKCTLHHY